MTYYNRDNIFNYQPRLIGPIGNKGPKGDTANIFDINGNLDLNNNIIYNLSGITFDVNSFNIDSDSINTKIRLNTNRIEIGGKTGDTNNFYKIINGTTNQTSCFISFENPTGYTIDNQNPIWLIGKRHIDNLNNNLSIWKNTSLDNIINDNIINAISIDKNDNVGLNVNHPNCKLDIYCDSPDNRYLVCGTGSTLRSLIFRTIDNTGITHIINAPSVSGNILFNTNNIQRLWIANNGNIGIGITDNFLGATLDINGSSIRIRQSNPPGSTTSPGNTGEMRWDNDYIYVRTNTQWKRAGLINF